MNFVGELSHPEWLESEELKEVFEKLDNNAMVVGGAVRDTLAHRDKKITDIDIATPIKPDEVLKRLKTLKKGKYAVKDVGIKHGTISVFTDEVTYEITTLRTDDETDGRHAEVSFTDDYRKDAERRDFTFNAMYANLNGQVYDPFHGIYDLSHGIVRFIGNAEKRISEDYLRMLRFFRFFAYYGNGRVDPSAYTACRKMASNLEEISNERIRDELFKILLSRMPEDIFLLMQNIGVLDFCLKTEINIGALRQLVWLEGRGLRIDEVGEKDAIRRLACLIKCDGVEVGKFLKLSNKQKKALKTLKKIRIKNTISKQEIKEIIEEHGIKIFLDILLISWSIERDIEVKSKENAKWREVLDFAINVNIPDFPVNGNDLIGLGITEGKKIGETLKSLKSSWVSSGFEKEKQELLREVEIH
jgi:poly(A) polymerase